MLNARTLALSAISLSLASACGGPESESLEDSEQGLSAISETVVMLRPDGTHEVRINQLSPDEAARRDAAHAGSIALRSHSTDEAGIATSARGLTQDTGCQSAALWLYDAPDQTGNRICFIGQGSARLADYTRSFYLCGGYPRTFCRSTWAGAVRSLWAGNEAGHLQEGSWDSCWVRFGRNQRLNLLGCMVGADRVILEE